MRRTLLILPFLAVAAQPAGFGEDRVTHLAFSPDGKTLTAAYFRHATNRPGTNWGSFGVTWDVATGKATTLPSAIGPVAYSPDGKLLATGQAERSPEPGRRNRPYVRLVLWTPGEAKPATVLTAPTDPGPKAAVRDADKGSVVTFAFHPGGKYLAVASVDQLWRQPLSGKAEPVADLKLTPAWWGTMPRLAFHDGGKLLRLSAASADGRRTLTAIGWRVEAGETSVTFTEVSRETLKDEPAGMREVTLVSPDGATKATASGATVTLEDARTGKALRELRPER